MSSTLVETININAEDFTDNFLTCPTCMSAYDEGEHTPKLLPCSHTLCRLCLEQIAATSTTATNQQIFTSNNNDTMMNTNTLMYNNSLSRTIAAADAALALVNLNNSNNNNNVQSNSNQSDLSPLLNINSSRLSNSSIVSNRTNSSNSMYSNNGNDLCTIRCPICRENIHLPRNGGIFSLPPSFIINQLIDLVKSRRSRDVVPRCTNHTNEELLYCETCDKSFCSICESHFTVATNADHIIIPFSIALKRITEIYFFKSSQCINSFNLALANVQNEIVNLNQNVEQMSNHVEHAFNDLKKVVENQKQLALRELYRIKETKTNVLGDQIKLIMNEKQKVEQELKDYQQLSLESKSLGAKIHNINEKLDCLRHLCEPRENCFINFESKLANSIQLIEHGLRNFSRFKTSNTYPPLCSAKILDENFGHLGSDHQCMNNTNQSLASNKNTSNNANNNGRNSSDHIHSVNLAIQLQLDTVDYFGQKRTDGGDPVSIIITDPSARQLVFKTPSELTDLNNGTYQFKFVPNQIGKLWS
jgi:hypothetical protein